MNPNPELKCELKYIVYTGRSKQVRIFIWILWVIDNFLERLNGSEEARQFVSAWEKRCWTVKSVFSGSGRLLLWSVAPLINSDLSFPHSHNFVPSSILFIPSMCPGPDRFCHWNQIHLTLDYLLEQAERGMRQIERGAIWLKSLSVIASPG